jgi:hypothetical protein
MNNKIILRLDGYRNETDKVTQGILKVAIVLPPRRQICQVRQDSFGFLGALYKNLASLAVII